MKSILITGASRGIGKALIQYIADEYSYIAICSRNKESLIEAVTGCFGDRLLDTGESNEVYAFKQNTGACNQGVIHLFEGDVSDYDFVNHMINRIIADADRLDVLVNNAGISVVGLFTDMTPSEWKKIIDVNLTSVYNTCHAAAPHMIHEKQGKIINISSVWGLAGASCEVAYSTTKGAINSFTKALAKELAPSNISVNAIAFGAIDTSMNGHLSIEEKDMLEEEIPYGRMATPEEAAMCIKNIIDMPQYFTGEVVKFDGGWL